MINYTVVHLQWLLTNAATIISSHMIIYIGILQITSLFTIKWKWIYYMFGSIFFVRDWLFYFVYG